MTISPFLREQQLEMIDLIDELPRRRSLALEAPTGVGKGLSLDTPILTGDGWSTMDKLSPGDTVHAIDGTLAPILAVSDVKLLDCYRVHFADGSTFVCDEEHLWHVFDEYRNVPGAGKYPKKKGSWRVVDIATIAANYDISHPRWNRKHRYGVRTDRIIERPATDLPIDPYLLGWWLGNGDSRDPVITTHIDDGPYLVECLDSLGLRHFVRENSSRSEWRIHISHNALPLITILRSLDLRRNKHVPEMYLLASAEQRAALLAGLLDSDGHTSRGAAGEFTSTIEDLARGTLFLLRSLGYKATIKEGRATLNGKDYGPKWRVHYSVSINHHPYRSPRRIAQVTSVGSKQTHTNKIIKVERISSIPTRCIVVDHPSHVFLAGESLTPTHNSRAALYAAAQDQKGAIIATSTKALSHQYARETELVRAKTGATFKVMSGRRAMGCRCPAKQRHHNARCPWPDHLAEARKADVVITNFALLAVSCLDFVDLAPRRTVIIDEAHEFAAPKEQRNPEKEDDENSVYWTPDQIAELLLERGAALTFLSATLSLTHPSYTHLLDPYTLISAGIPVHRTAILPSPFSWSSQLTLGHYRQQDGDWPSFAVNVARRLDNRGKLFIVRSHREKHKVANALQYAGHEVLLQEDPKNSYPEQARKVTQAFNNTPSLCVVGTDTLMTGLDVPGDALGNVIVCGPPEIYGEWKNLEEANARLRRTGGSHLLNDYLIPNRAMRLTQAIGRGVRSTTDTATVVVGCENQTDYAIYDAAAARFS